MSSQKSGVCANVAGTARCHAGRPESHRAHRPGDIIAAFVGWRPGSAEKHDRAARDPGPLAAHRGGMALPAGNTNARAVAPRGFRRRQPAREARAPTAGPGSRRCRDVTGPTSLDHRAALRAAGVPLPVRTTGALIPSVAATDESWRALRRLPGRATAVARVARGGFVRRFFAGRFRRCWCNERNGRVSISRCLLRWHCAPQPPPKRIDAKAVPR